jgi:hypothetical protein
MSRNPFLFHNNTTRKAKARTRARARAMVTPVTAKVSGKAEDGEWTPPGVKPRGPLGHHAGYALADLMLPRGSPPGVC